MLSPSLMVGTSTPSAPANSRPPAPVSRMTPVVVPNQQGPLGAQAAAEKESCVSANASVHVAPPSLLTSTAPQSQVLLSELYQCQKETVGAKPV